MRIIKDEIATLKRHRRVTVELLPGEQLASFNNNQMYALGDPMGDIVPGHILNNIWPVYWCPIAQKWER